MNHDKVDRGVREQEDRQVANALECSRQHLDGLMWNQLRAWGDDTLFQSLSNTFGPHLQHET